MEIKRSHYMIGKGNKTAILVSDNGYRIYYETSGVHIIAELCL